METIYPLDELEETYHHHDQAAGHAEAPSGDLHIIPALPSGPETSLLIAASSPVSRCRGLRFGCKTSLAPHKGTTVRAKARCPAHLRDMRAFSRWLLEAGYLTTSIKVPLQRLPETLFPILTDDALERVWTSRYLTGKSGMAVRNRALVGLMLDSGLRRAEVDEYLLQELPTASLKAAGRTSISRCREN